RRDRCQACRLGATFHGQHEARHRAVRPGRAGYPQDPGRHPRVPEFGGPARGSERAARAPGAGLQRPLTWMCVVESPMMQRRLAAIGHADLAGFTRMMEGAETRTFRHLKAAQTEVWRPAIEAASGRLVGTAGDAMLAEFASAVTAVSAAIDIQERMARFNEGLAP